jgi:ATP-dependent Lhr-like helicase
MISALLQRVGRAGHAIGAIPKGRLFPLSLDDLVECTRSSTACGAASSTRSACRESPRRALAADRRRSRLPRMGRGRTVRRLPKREPYKDLTAEEFEQVLQMLAEGYSTRRGRRSAYLHYDTVNRRLRPEKARGSPPSPTPA